MTNLMDDLRSGRQKTRLKPIKLEEAPLVSESRTPILENGIEEKFIPDLMENEEKEKIVSYYADRNLWIIVIVELFLKGISACQELLSIHALSRAHLPL